MHWKYFRMLLFLKLNLYKIYLNFEKKHIETESGS